MRKVRYFLNIFCNWKYYPTSLYEIYFHCQKPFRFDIHTNQVFGIKTKTITITQITRYTPCISRVTTDPTYSCQLRLSAVTCESTPPHLLDKEGVINDSDSQTEMTPCGVAGSYWITNILWKYCKGNLKVSKQDKNKQK